MKRIYITLVVLLLGMVAMAYLYFSNLNTETNANELSLNTVAANSGIIFSFENDKSFYDILSGQDLFQQVLGKDKSAQIRTLKDILLARPAIAKALNGQKIYMGFIPIDQRKVGFLIGAQFNPGAHPQQLINGSGAKVKTVGNSYELTFNDSTQCFVGFKNNTVLLADALTVIETALKAQKTEKQGFVDYIKNNSRFNKNTLASLFIDFSKLPSFLKPILNSNINGELQVFNKQQAYAAFSYNFSKEKLLFNGNMVISDERSYYKLFDQLQAQEISINQILPQKTANYTIFTIPDYATWYQELLAWQAKNKEAEKIKTNISNIGQQYRIDLNELFLKYFEHELVTFQLNSGEKFGAIALNNGEKVAQLLLDLSSDYAPNIKIFKEPGIAYAYFGEPFKKFERPFYTIINNYLVMSNNASSVQVFLNSYEKDALLINDGDYQHFGNQISSSANISFYINYKNSNDIFGRNLKPAYFKHYQSGSGFRPFDAFAYQLSGDKGKFIANVVLAKKPEKIAAIDTLKQGF